MRAETADEAENNSLVSPPFRDKLLVKISGLHEQELAAKEMAKVNAEKRALEAKKAKYFKAFEELYYKYFGLSKESLRKLSIEEIKELREMFYEKAKRQLWWKIPLWLFFTFSWIPAFFLSFLLINTFSISFVLRVFGVIDMVYGSFFGFISNYSTWGFVRLHNWHKKAEIESEPKNEIDSK